MYATYNQYDCNSLDSAYKWIILHFSQFYYLCLFFLQRYDQSSKFCLKSWQKDGHTTTHKLQWNPKGPYQNRQNWCWLFHLFLTLMISIVCCILTKWNTIFGKIAVNSYHFTKMQMSTKMMCSPGIVAPKWTRHPPSQCFYLSAVRQFQQLFLN